MKTIKKSLIVLSTSIMAVTFGCGSENSVKDNSGDNIHEEDKQDDGFNRKDSTAKDSTAFNQPDSSEEKRNGNR
jgi:hypothetical protein